MSPARPVALAAGALAVLLSLPAGGADTRDVPGPVRLSAASIDKLTNVMTGLVEAVRKDPSIMRDLPARGSEQETLDHWAQRIEASPRISAIFKKAGVAPRDYIISLLSLAQAQAYSFASRQGQAPKDQDPIVLDNAKLIESHPAEMKRLAEAGSRLQSLEEQHRATEDQGPASPGQTRPEPKGEMRGGAGAGSGAGKGSAEGQGSSERGTSSGPGGR